MKKPLFFLLITLIILCQTIILKSQDIVQLTSGESQQYDSNFEQFFNVEGVGHYSSYIDDRVNIFNSDTDEKVYESSFDMCENEIVRWIIAGDEVIYISYQSIIIEHILDGTMEEYMLEYSSEEDFNISLSASAYRGVLSIGVFPGPINIYFDIEKRHFLDDPIWGHVYTTKDYFYRSYNGFSGKQFVRINRNTFEIDTILSNFSTDGGIVKSDDKHYFLTEDYPMMVIDSNDNIKTYEFEHGRLNSGIETSTGRLVLAELIAGGTVLYEMDITTSELVRQDTIWSDSGIILLDSYQDRLYVEYSTQFDESYGYMDYPYTEVEVFPFELEHFHDYFNIKSQNLFAILTSNSEYFRKLIIVEKSTNEIIEFQFETSHLFLDLEFEIIDTGEGVRLIVNEEKGKTVYSYDDESNSITKLNSIANKRGLGTEVRKNGDSYLIATEHSLHHGFEYIDPNTNELVYHEVDGIIHGEVIPYNDKYFYIRNQNYNGIDEDFYLDYVMFDPITEEIKLIKEKFFYPKITHSFSNINFSQVKYGFTSVFNTNLFFDLDKEIELSFDPITKELMDRIYFESDNYYYSSTKNTSSSDPKHYRIDKNDYENRELIFEDDNYSLVKLDENSFAATLPDKVYYVNDNQVITLDPPAMFNINAVRLVDTKVFLFGYTTTSTILKTYNIETGAESNIEIEGYVVDFVGEYIISYLTFEPPYETLSTHLESGNTYSRISDELYSRLYRTDTSIYILNNELNEINVLNPKWEEINTIDASILNNTSLQLISDPYELPLAYRAIRPWMPIPYKDVPDYSLVIFDPRTEKISEYFDCDSELRFHKAFDFGETSTMLLRTEDQGYQVHSVSLPEYVSIPVVEEDGPLESIIISPNPTNRYVDINIEYDKAILFNSIGQALGQFQNEKIIDFANQPNGVFYLEVTKDGKVFTSKIIKH